MKPEIEFIIEAIDVLCPNGGTWNGTEVTPVSDPVPTKAELDAQIEIQKAEYDALAWKRSREENYPSVQELVVALYDTDDKSAIETKRAAVKKKYPKP